jgi:hypothetical protein
MQTLIQVLAPLVTVLLFIAGLFLLNQNARRDIKKDFAIKIQNLQVESIAKTTVIMENIRILYWKLATKTIDLSRPLDKETEIILYEISGLRSDWFAASLFLPEQLKDVADSLNIAFTNFTDVILEGEKFEGKKEVNEKVHQLISDWRIKAQDFIKEERIRLINKFDI